MSKKKGVFLQVAILSKQFVGDIKRHYTEQLVTSLFLQRDNNPNSKWKYYQDDANFPVSTYKYVIAPAVY